MTNTSSTFPTPPTAPNVHERPSWQLTTLAIASMLLAISLMVAPGVLASRSTVGPLGEPILAGTVGAVGALVCFPALLLGAGLSPRVAFIRRPNRYAVWWAGSALAIALGLFLVSLLVTPTTVEFGTDSLTGIGLRFTAAFAIGLWTGAVEELLVRGVFLSFLGHRWQWPGAIVVTAVLFGLLHHGAADGTLARALYVLVTTTAGLLLGLLVVVTGNVWNAVGFHAGWNTIFAGYLVDVEPGDGSNSLVAYHLEDPGWLVGAGGAALPESPLALLLLALLASGYWWHHRCGAATSHTS